MESNTDGRGPRVSRRLVIIGGVAVVLAAGGGVAAGFIEPVGGSKPTPPSRAAARGLTEALAAERRLVADVAAALAVAPARSHLHSKLAQLHRDHVAHERALAALVSDESTPAPARTSGSASTSARPRPRVLARAALRTAETDAATRAATLATALTGPAATVLASIAACEATHAELLA